MAKNKNIHNLSITQQIDVNFRNYALYVLEHRGIPSFDDALTNVQRFILTNAPASYNKTLSLVGSCIASGYHHGDFSLVGAINKLARPHGNSCNLLQGDGFFGSPVESAASAARYTSIRIEPKIAEMIRNNNFLNAQNENDNWEPLWLDLPIGLCTMIVGIAVGYKTTVLPRKLEDMQKFLDGKVKEVKPYFNGFTGKITRYQNLDKTWLISGVSIINDKEKTIRVTELPPIIKYSSFLKRVNQIIGDSANVTIINNSTTNVDIVFKCKGPIQEWEELQTKIDKATKIIITETLVFVKNGRVLNYAKVEDYLTDFKYRIAELKVNRLSHFLKTYSEELLFQQFKKLFLEYMLSTKELRTAKEIDVYIKALTTNETVSRRLGSILLKSMSEDEYKETIAKIAQIQLDIAKQESLLHVAKEELNIMIDTTSTRGNMSQKSQPKNLMSDADEPEEIDGIAVWGMVEEIDVEDGQED